MGYAASCQGYRPLMLGWNLNPLAFHSSTERSTNSRAPVRPGVDARKEDVAVGVGGAYLGQFPVLVLDGLGRNTKGAGAVNCGVDGEVYAGLVHLGDAVRAVGVEALGEEVAVNLLGCAGERESR